MKKNINQIDLFAVENKSNQSKNILTAIDIGSDKIVCFIAKIDEVTREKRDFQMDLGVKKMTGLYLVVMLVLDLE